MFERLTRPETSVQACARTIRQAILSGELGVGERLPPERQLSETLGVNRLTLRSALGQLSVAGLLSVRQGSGYVVQDYRVSGGPDLLPGLASLATERGDLTEVVADLLLVRRHLARAVLERVAATEDLDITDAVAAVDAFEAAVVRGANTEEYALADVAVIGALLATTGSAVLGLCLNPVLAVVTEMRALREVIYADPASNVAGYRLLIEWMRAPDRAAIDMVISQLEQRDRASVALLSQRGRRKTARRSQ